MKALSAESCTTSSKSRRRGAFRFAGLSLACMCLAACAADGGATASSNRSRTEGALPQGGAGLNGASPAPVQAGNTPVQNPGSISPNAGANAPAIPATAPPPAAGCDRAALDQMGCACDQIGATRPCYSAAPATRNVGMCKDGIQTCNGVSGTEFGAQWGPCMEQVVPTECKSQLDARCVGKVGCADEQCADKLGCNDAGTDAGNPKCHTVMGFGSGFGFFPDGGMWCEI
jgi:hypothetical protein